MSDDADVVADLAERIEWPDREVAQQARLRWQQFTKPASSLGRLEDLGTWWSATRGSCPAPAPEHPVLVVLAGDHGVARSALTSGHSPDATPRMVRHLLEGTAAACAMATTIGTRIRVVDAGVDAPDDYLDDIDPAIVATRIRRSTGSIDRESAMTVDEARAAIALGVAVADAEIDAGADLIAVGDVGVGSTVAATAIIGLLAPADTTSIVGRGSGIDDAGWMRKTAAVRDATRRGRPHKGSAVDLLAEIGAPDIAALVGLLLGAAARKTPVLLDGVTVAAAALIAHRAAYKSREWWQAATLSTEPAHAAALGRLDLDPLFTLRMAHGEGTGALLAVPLVRAAAAALNDLP